MDRLGALRPSTTLLERDRMPRSSPVNGSNIVQHASHEGDTGSAASGKRGRWVPDW
jgi:hypothetical protein